MINEQYKYSELTSKIIGLLMTVHSSLGKWVSRSHLSKALAIELNIAA